MTMEHLQVKFAPSEIDSVTGEFKGYGAVFGNIDSHGDVIMPGAFKHHTEITTPPRPAMCRFFQVKEPTHATATRPRALYSNW